MRPAGRHSSVAISDTPNQTSPGSLRIVTEESLNAIDATTPHDQPREARPLCESPIDEHRRRLAVTIRHRIETRLAGRVRDLDVRIVGDAIVLEGRCATYYTKQLAQHAALGVIEDEQLENAIIVMMS